MRTLKVKGLLLALAAFIRQAPRAMSSPGYSDRLLELGRGQAFRTSGRPIAAPVYRDGRGNPVLFAASLFDELRGVQGDRGGRPVIARDPQRVAEVPVDARMPADIDTPEDYEAARRARPTRE